MSYEFLRQIMSKETGKRDKGFDIPSHQEDSLMKSEDRLSPISIRTTQFLSGSYVCGIF